MVPMSLLLRAVLIVLGLALGFPVFFGHCQAAEAVESIPGDEGQAIQLKITWWGSPRRHELTQQVLRLFEHKYPHIRVDADFFDWIDYFKQMENLSKSDRLPDIMQHDYSALKYWVERDRLLSLDSFIDSGAIDITNIAQSTIDTGRLNGQVYGLSLGVNSQVFLLDVEAFRKAGVQLPQADWTWDDFEACCLQLRQKLGVWGMGEGLLVPQLLLQSYLLGHGQWTYNDAQDDLGYDDVYLVDYLKMILRLQKAGAIPHRNESKNLLQDPPNDVEIRSMVYGRSAMETMQSNQVIAFMAAAGQGREFKMQPLPRPQGGRPTNWVKQSMFFSVLAESRHPQEAALLIDFFTNSLEANEIMLGERGVPTSEIIRQNLQLHLSEAQFDMFVYQALIDHNASPTPPPNPPVHGLVIGEEYYSEFINPVLLEELSPAEGAKRLRARARKLLGH